MKLSLLPRDLRGKLTLTFLAVGVLPLVAVVIAALLTWQQLTTWRDIALLAGMYAVCGLGITVGFHRMLTHRSFEAHPAVRFTLLAMGSMAGLSDPVPVSYTTSPSPRD